MNFPVLNEEIIIQKVNVPTLIVNGIYDPLVEMENFEQYRGAFKSLKTFKFEQSGHAPHIEEPNHFLNAFRKWLGSSICGACPDCSNLKVFNDLNAPRYCSKFSISTKGSYIPLTIKVGTFTF